MLTSAIRQAFAEAVDSQHEEISRSAEITAADLVAAAVAGYGTEVCTVVRGVPVTTGLRMNNAAKSVGIAVSIGTGR